MSNDYNIKFFDTLVDAFNYQNTQGGALYVKGETSDSNIEYEIATYLTEIDNEEELEKLGRFVVVDECARSVIERGCFKIK